MIRTLILLLLLAPPLPAASDDSRFGRQPVEWGSTLRPGKASGIKPTFRTLRRAARRADRSRTWWLGWLAFGGILTFFAAAISTAFTLLFTAGAAGLVLYPMLRDALRLLRRTI